MMNISKAVPYLILVTTSALIGCTSTAPPPPEPVSAVGQRLIDPASDFQIESPAIREQMTAAWSAFQKGQLETAERGWRTVLETNPDFPPALVGIASVAVARGQLARARELVLAVEDYAAARVLKAELLASDGHVIEAAEMLQPLVSRPGTPARVIQRSDQLREEAVASLLTQATSTGSAEERAEILKRALRLDPHDRDARLQLVEELISIGRYADAREALEPSIEVDAAMNRVQAALAEIEIGEKKYQNAMRRYERLVERTGDVVYQERLERAKRLWNESTFPQQFQLAVRSPNITREQLAVLLFWKMPSIRFAQNLQKPPIVVDIAEVMGREELIRVLTLGLLPMDRSTRSARPRKTVTRGEFLSSAASALRYASSDPCSRADVATPAQLLEACGIDTLQLERDPGGFLTGATAATILDQVAELDRSAE